MLQALLWACATDAVSCGDFVAALDESKLFMAESAHETTLADALWVVGSQVEQLPCDAGESHSKAWKTLCKVVKDIADKKFVPAMTLQTILELDVLHEVGLANEPAAVGKKIVRINTRSLYTQSKFNLLREESEGFAKVLSLLHSGVTRDTVEAVQRDLLALIGTLRLPPHPPPHESL